MPSPPAFEFAAIGVDHPHVFEMTREMISAGCRLHSFFSVADGPARAYAGAFPEAERVSDEREILEDGDIRLVLGAGINSERAAMAVRAMRHGKDVVLDKPGATTTAQLAEMKATCRETGRFVTIFYSEHLTQKATIKAGELVRAGAIGRVIQTVGLGPHRLGSGRPDWFFRKPLYGGILADIASHQFEQFLLFTGGKSATVSMARAANLAHPDHPELQDFGEAVLAGDNGTSGYVRVDWFTPTGMPVWGDGRLFILGTDGQIELRKYVDIAGRPGGDHLFLADQSGVRHIDCSGVAIDYGERVRDDVLNRTDTALDRDRCFLATELALAAQALADTAN
jgi:predicted dehydrogenase